jgi:asparagine synthase (glutamine-hydrolysing)
MGDYLLVSRDPAREAAAGLSESLQDRARANGLEVSALTPTLWLATRGPHPPPVSRIGRWILVGDVLDRRAPQLPQSPDGDPWDWERKLLARIWGRYVGVLEGRGGQAAALLRDPSGARECVCWTQDGLTLACGAVEDWLLRGLRPAWRLAPDRLALALHDALPGAGRLLLDGPVALEPGTLQPLPPTEPAVVLWRPVELARLSQEAALTTNAAAGRLAAAVDEAVAGLASLGGPLAAEVSGGLDSGVVAAALSRSSAAPVRLWLNAWGDTPEADERAFAARIGDRLGFAPVFAPHATAPLTIDWLEAASTGFRPGLNALDRPHDLDWARRLKEAGVAALMTGRGGDSILFNTLSADVFADAWARRGWRTLRSPDMIELAAATETSVWTLVAEARRRLAAAPASPRRDHPLFAPLEGPIEPPPWLEDCAGLGPGKIVHILGVLDSVALHGPTAQTAAVDVRNPLCAQPVVEACLALPTPVLVAGGRDRGLARLAFQDRLPAEVVGRRSKGDMTRLYGRLIVEGLDVLRPWLIEGRLAALGLVDRAAAERELTPDALIWRGQYGAVMAAAAFEGWVRAWERRLQPAG